MKARIATLTLVCALACSAASAAEIYVGAGVGRSEFEQADVSGLGGIDADDTGYKVFAGAYFMKYVGVEASWVDFGTFDQTLNPSIPTTATASADAIAVYGVGKFPILPRFDVFGKFGFASWNADTTVTTMIGMTNVPNSESFDGTDAAWGLGVQFQLVSGLWIRGEYETFEVEDLNKLRIASASLTWRF